MSQAALSHTVSLRYNALVSAQKLETDPAQLALVDRLDRLLENIQQKQLSTKSSSLGWLFNRNSGRKASFKGLYIHGKVGRGKSMLMDIFYELAPISPKRRVHFNEFMTDAHDRIHAHRKAFEKGETREEDPIKPVGRALAREAPALVLR